MQTKKIILRSILNQQISKRKIIIGKYFMFLYHKAHSQKFYERSPNKKASKNKSVASSIREMQYQDEQNQNSQNSKNDSEEMLMEFDMDEDSGAEPIAEENNENQTN